MATKTTIEWTDYNWNFLRGCSRVSEGCRNCYAEGVAARFSGPGQPYEGLAKFVEHKPRWTGEISFVEDALVKPLHLTKPRKIFVNSMSDLFHEKVKDEWLDRAFAVMALTPQHTYQCLTKRPERMLEYLTGRPRDGDQLSLKGRIALAMGKTAAGNRPLMEKGDEITRAWDSFNWNLPNVHLGVSVEDQKTADERIPILLDTPGAVRWLSVEPLLGPVDFYYYGGDHGDPISFSQLRGTDATDPNIPGIDWIVVGAESGPNARPCKIEWIESIVDQCRAANVPVFVKQIQIAGRICKDIEQFPQHLQIREFPSAIPECWDTLVGVK